MYTYFWSGPFSNFYPSPLSQKAYAAGKRDPFTYGCVEQFFMAEKARHFKDEETRNLILCTSIPREQKKLDRQVKGFDQAEWEKVCQRIMYWGNFLKYTQNPELKELLLATDPTTLVEASPRDKIWGIGLGEDEAKVTDPSDWPGKNWLGEILTQLREDLISYDAIDKTFGSAILDNRAVLLLEL